MRIDNSNFAARNNAASAEPRFVIELSFDTASSDIVYLTSHAITGLTGANVYPGLIHVSGGISGTTQKLNPDKANSTIGAISFKVLDEGLTDLQRDKLNAGKGLKGKRVRIYVGEAELEWSDYTLVQTQAIDSEVSYKDGVYSFSCADVQRQMRKDVFEPKKTSLSTSLAAGASTINVYSTNGFELVKQPASPTGLTDAPGQKVGYLRLSNGCIVRYTGKTANSFTGCVWGRFNTAHLIEPIEKTADSTADNAPKVEEYIYLEMPAVKVIYALLTGFIYGESGEKLPDHWHLGIHAQWIRTSDFISVGSDWWDLTSDDNGIPAVVRGVAKTDGKKFIEEELLLMIGAFMPVYANGEIGLRRMTVIPSQGSYLRVLDEKSVVSYTDLKHDLKAVMNRVVISWNYEEQRKEYTRKSILFDENSIATHGAADVQEMKFRTLASSRHSYATIKNQFDSLRDRYAGPPLRIQLTVLPYNNDLEVGDIVRVKLDAVKDYTGSLIDGHLDRNFEVQQVRVDWITGRVVVDLFGSSQSASVLPPEETGTAIVNDFYNAAGTEINATNFPGKITVTGGITRITGDVTLSSGGTLSNSIYYCLGDLTIDAGVTVRINQNVQLRVRGFFQVNGKIDGKGRGHLGGFPAGLSPSYGFLGHSESTDGVYLASGSTFPNRSYLQTAGTRQVLTGTRPQNTAPLLNLSVTQAGNLLGIPADLRGTPGPAGGASYETRSGNLQWSQDGGVGGSGGAGLVVICRGMDIGASGVIDTSGDDGASGTYHPAATWYKSDRWMISGSGGGGCPGAAYFVIDGNQNPPHLNPSNAKAEFGSSPLLTGRYYLSGRVNVNNSVGSTWDDGGQHTAVGSAHVGAYASRVNTYESNHRVQILTGHIAPAPTVPAHAAQPSAVILSEATNTPKSAAGNLSSIEASVIPPADTNYAHSIIEYRPVGGQGWFRVGPAAPEAVFVVRSDGASYEVRALSVGKGGGVSSSGPIATIKTTRVIAPGSTDDPLSAILKVPNVRGLELFEQGNNTEFGGRDAKFQWRKTSVTEFFPLGSEPAGLGASAGALDLYFRDYQVEVWAQNRLVRTEWVVDPLYIYSYEKNAEDYKRVNNVAGAWRSFTVKVWCRSRQNQLSPTAAALDVSNPPSLFAVAPTVDPGFKVIRVAVQAPADLDYLETRVYLSTTPGFTPSAANYAGSFVGGVFTIGNLSDSTEYRVRLEPWDAFGAGTLSAEIVATTQDLGAAMGLGPWATVTEADRDFINEHVGNGAIDGTKIDKITAGQIVTGTLAATEKISVEGQVESLAGGYTVTLGPKALNGKVALLSASYTGGVLFSIYEDGTAKFTDGIAWNGTTLSVTGNIVATTTGGYSALPADQLYLGADRIGAKGSTQGWYIENYGYFSFPGASLNQFSWNGSRLFVRGVNEVQGTHEVTSQTTTEKTTLSTNKVRFTNSGGSSAEYGFTGMSVVYDLGAGHEFKVDSNGFSYETTPNRYVAWSGFGLSVSTDSAGTGLSVTAYGSNSGAVAGDGSLYGGSFGCLPGGWGPVVLGESSSSAAPTHYAPLGTLWVTSAGILYINTSNGTTWQKVGAQ
jgi:hypothetical protein